MSGCPHCGGTGGPAGPPAQRARAAEVAGSATGRHADELADYAARIERLALDLGFVHHAVEYELVPDRFMMETAVYGLPVRMPHWSFGVCYIRELVQRTMGLSRIFEVMFPGDPCHAYLVDANSLPENVLVVAHVLGHADFSARNTLFVRSMRMAGGHILEQAAARAHRIEQALTDHGQARVEAVLDAALALEAHVDLQRELHRKPYPVGAVEDIPVVDDAFRSRWHALPGEAPTPQRRGRRPGVPPHPEYDLVWFIAHYGPELDDWERDIFLAVREESFYFHPVFACQIMNEGWASYWHARLLREADFLPNDLYLAAIKAHSDVVRPHAAGRTIALSVNPYHLGFSMWERIVAAQGLEAARRICADEDDFGFIRNHLDRALADELDLFVYEASDDGQIKVVSRDLRDVREAILAPKFNFGAPRVAATSVAHDGTLTLTHDHAGDGRGLDLKRAQRVLDYVVQLWRRPVVLLTVDDRGQPERLKAAPGS
ncbi:MAG TPA: SpoVR family protein [Casimicrobiaceae bacterium]|nr:SpoVR family protein [Casimicrobiaceae bacterium]